MSKMTAAEKDALIAQLQAENEALKQNQTRPGFSCDLWPNRKKGEEGSNPNLPDFGGSSRFVIPPGLQAGDALWLDYAMWYYDPETSPRPYKTNPPEFSGTLRQCSADYAAEQEKRYQAAMAKKAAASKAA